MIGTLVATFFSGAFIANSIPHFVSGVMGRKFPSPFASPPGKGLSSARTNMWWGLANFVVGYALLGVSGFAMGFSWNSLVFLVGFTLMSWRLAAHFGSVKM